MALSKELIASVKKHEGFRARAYKDTVGVWTIGYGTNLQVTTIDPLIAEAWLIRDLEKCKQDLYTIPIFRQLSEVRQSVLIEMCYNLGYQGLISFKNMWAALTLFNFELAAKCMEDSVWAMQVGQRAKTLSARMRTGQWETKELIQQEPSTKAKSSFWAWDRWF